MKLKNDLFTLFFRSSSDDPPNQTRCKVGEGADFHRVWLGVNADLLGK